MNPIIRVMLWGNSLWSFAAGMFVPLFALWAEKIGGSILDISSAYAIFLLVTGIATIFFGRYSDKPGRHEKLLVIGYFLIALLNFSYLFISNTTHLFLVEAGFGLATAMVNPSWYSLFSRHHSKRESGKEWGLSQGLQEILMAIGTFIGGVVVSMFGFNMLFMVMGAIQLVVAGIYVQLLGKKSGSKKTRTT